MIGEKKRGVPRWHTPLVYQGSSVALFADNGIGCSLVALRNLENVDSASEARHVDGLSYAGRCFLLGYVNLRAVLAEDFILHLAGEAACYIESGDYRGRLSLHCSVGGDCCYTGASTHCDGE